MSSPAPDLRLSLALMALAELSLLGFAWALGGWLGVPVFATLQWDAGDFVLGLLASLPSLAGLLWTMRAKGGPLGSLRRTVEEELLPMFQGAPLLALAAVAIAAGLGEELLMRGLLQVWLTRHLPPALVIGLLALLFGLLHPLSRVYVAFATAMGLWMGLLFHWTGGLLAPVTAHATHDLLGLWWLVAQAPPRPSTR